MFEKVQENMPLWQDKKSGQPKSEEYITYHIYILPNFQEYYPGRAKMCAKLSKLKIRIWLNFVP